jgi:NDP-sugar pyrophosphorylase family protein
MITTIMKRFKTTIEIRTNYDENILIYNENDKRIYQLEPTYNKKKVEIFKGIISKENRNNNFRERSDLFETGVDICSPKFLEQMTEKEKFDLISVKDFIGQILSDEIYEDTFYLQELNENSYCGLIRNIESYLKVNFEILNRWAYPLVIDNIDMSNKLEINLKQLRLSLYSDKDTNSENFRKAELFREVAILNKENIVGRESKLNKCVLCKNVKIGEKCFLDNCIIFSGTTIENNVTIKNSIIGKGCYIKTGIKIISSILGSNIDLDKDAIQKRIYKDDFQINDISNKEFVQKLEKYEKLFLTDYSNYGFNESNLDTEKAEDKNKLLDDEEFYSDEESEQSIKEESFAEGVEYILSSGIEKNKEPKELVNEIWNLRNDKLVSNPTMEETLKICLSYILKQYLNGKKFVGNKKSAKELIDLFNDWKILFDKFVPDENIELKLISVFEQICIEIDEINSAFHIIIKILNGQCHLIKDETLINWSEKEESSYETNEETIVIPSDINKKNKKKIGRLY